MEQTRFPVRILFVRRGCPVGVCGGRTFFREAKYLAAVGAADRATRREPLHIDELMFFRERTVDEAGLAGHMFP